MAVVPLYNAEPEKWARLMRTTLAFNGSHFNTNRMVHQYVRNAYYPVKLINTVRVEEPSFAR
jgi:starch phosphorylase